MILAVGPNLGRIQPLPPITGAAWQRGVTPQSWRFTVLFNGRLDLRVMAANDADGWVVKPLDAFRLRRAATALLGGGTYTEGLPGSAEPEGATVARRNEVVAGP